MAIEFADVTELAGSEITVEQLERMAHRYGWAMQFCRGKDVAEVGCGSGQGLGLLARVANSLEAGDSSSAILGAARGHYGQRLRFATFDAQNMPYADKSKDVIVLFEAIYYLHEASRFVQECCRVLRPGGCVLVATANKDLWDFNPSPLSQRYYGTVELAALFRGAGFDVELYGYMPVAAVSWRQRVLRPAKTMAVRLGIMPKTAAGKRLLKRLVFGRLVPMPTELAPPDHEPQIPVPLSALEPDRLHKVLYCRAELSR